MTLTRIDTYRGSVLVAVGSPAEILSREVDGNLQITLFGGGEVSLPREEIRMTFERQLYTSFDGGQS